MDRTDQNVEKVSNLMKIQSSLDILEDCARVFLVEDAEKMPSQITYLTELLSVVFPIVIEDYKLPAFARRQDEITVWVQLLQQIMQTMEGDDSFAKADILYEVLKPDLEEHIQTIREGCHE